MYKFPELVFKKPRFILNEYDLTSAFMESQKALFEKPKEELPDKIELVDLANKVNEFHEKKANASSDVVINPVKYDQMPDSHENNDFQFSLNNLPSQDGTQENERTVNYNMENIFNRQNNENNNFINNNVNDQNVGDSVFTNKSLEPDERQEKEYIAKKEEKKEEKPINPYNDGRPQMCPNCGARLAPGATTCFLCGTKLK